MLSSKQVGLGNKFYYEKQHAFESNKIPLFMFTSDAPCWNTGDTKFKNK